MEVKYLVWRVTLLLVLVLKIYCYEDCNQPDQENTDRYVRALTAAGCYKNASADDLKAFGECINEANPKLIQMIAEKTDNNQICRDETGEKFTNEGLLGDCEIIGTPKEDSIVRCTTCLRIDAFGFDPTKETIQALESCSLEKNKNKTNYAEK